MSEKGSKGLREMTTGCALAGFLMPILVMIVLIVLGAEDDRFFSSVVCNDRILYVYGI